MFFSWAILVTVVSVPTLAKIPGTPTLDNAIFVGLSKLDFNISNLQTNCGTSCSLGCCPVLRGVCCSNGWCCREGEMCCNGLGCCPRGNTCCASGCCPITDGVCCPGYCCITGYYCIDGGCCPDNETC